MDAKEINGLSNRVIGCAIKVHRALGPGFVEKIYAKALEHELKTHEITFSREASIPVRYEGRLVGTQRLDFLVEGEMGLRRRRFMRSITFTWRKCCPISKPLTSVWA